MEDYEWNSAVKQWCHYSAQGSSVTTNITASELVIWEKRHWSPSGDLSDISLPKYPHMEFHCMTGELNAGVKHATANLSQIQTQKGFKPKLFEIKSHVHYLPEYICVCVCVCVWAKQRSVVFGPCLAGAYIKHAKCVHGDVILQQVQARGDLWHDTTSYFKSRSRQVSIFLLLMSARDRLKAITICWNTFANLHLQCVGQLEETWERELQQNTLQQITHSFCFFKYWQMLILTKHQWET